MNNKSNNFIVELDNKDVNLRIKDAIESILAGCGRAEIGARCNPVNAFDRPHNKG